MGGGSVGYWKLVTSVDQMLSVNPNPLPTLAVSNTTKPQSLFSNYYTIQATVKTEDKVLYYLSTQNTGLKSKNGLYLSKTPYNLNIDPQTGQIENTSNKRFNNDYIQDSKGIYINIGSAAFAESKKGQKWTFTKVQ